MPRVIPRPSGTAKLSFAIASFALLAAFALAARSWLVRPVVAQTASHASSASPQATPRASDHVRRGLLKPALRENLRSLGDRLEKTGKERLTVTGTIRLKGDAQSRPVIFILEARGRLRVEEQGGSGFRTFIFDRDHATGRTLTVPESDLVETLLYDTPESFFALQETGAPTRSLGSGYRLNDSPAGSQYDVYEVQDTDAAGDPASPVTKVFCFNRETSMLERVRYERVAAGSASAIEVRLEDWGAFDGQKMPHRIVRLENNDPVLVITLDAVTFGPRGDNAAFVSASH